MDPLHLINGSLCVNLLESYHIRIGCVKLNFSLWAHPYKVKRTDIFLMEDSLNIMEAYGVFLLPVFETVARDHLCSQAVQNQFMTLYGGKASFHAYINVHPNKFLSATYER